MNILRTCVIALSCMMLTASTVSEPTMRFCDLMRHPEEYSGKLVRVRATWVYGFEWSYLHCLGCDGRVWFDSSELDEQYEKVLKHIPKNAGIVNVDVEGIFHAGGGFGHMNGYKYKLTAHMVANPTVISKGLKAAETEFEMEQKFACGGAKPR